MTSEDAGSKKFEDHVVMVSPHEDGRLLTLSPSEFHEQNLRSEKGEVPVVIQPRGGNADKCRLWSSAGDAHRTTLRAAEAVYILS